jgi:thiol-disulfide isomerase/thioredoxin
MTWSWRRLIQAALATVLAGCTVEPAKPARNGTPSDPLVIAPSGTTQPPMPKVEPRPPALLSSKKADAPKVFDLLQEAIRSTQYGNLHEAASKLDELLQLDPTNRRALALLAQVCERRAREVQRSEQPPLFLKGADAMRKLRAAFPELTDEEKRFLPSVLYNEGCALALLGDRAKALKSLAEAVDAGFVQPAQFDADADLDSLRKLPEFHTLQSSVERRHVEAVLASFKPFAFDFKLKDLEGKSVALADVKGDVTVVDFWGTWCPPCRKEIPHLVELSKKFQDKGVRVVGLSYETDSGDAARKTIAEYAKSSGIAYPCLIGDEETQNKVPDFAGFPTTLFVDKTGKVRLKLSGYQSLGTLEVAVNALLDQEKPKPVAKK